MSQLPRAQDGLSLPRGFTAVRDILDGCVRDRQSASIIGVVKEYRAPIPTKGAGEAPTFPGWLAEERLIPLYRLQEYLEAV